MNGLNMTFRIITPKYTWQYHNTNEDILSELKINTDVKKIQNYINKGAKYVLRKDRDG
jgi:hypothetical protein